MTVLAVLVSAIFDDSQESLMIEKIEKIFYNDRRLEAKMNFQGHYPVQMKKYSTIHSASVF